MEEYSKEFLRVLYVFGYKKNFSLPKQFLKPRSILEDRSRFFGIVLESKNPFIAQFHKTDLDIFESSRERKPCLIA